MGVQPLDYNLSRSIGYGVNQLPVDMGPDFIENGQFVGSPTRTYSERNLASFMLRAQYSLLDRYMLNLAVRMDGPVGLVKITNGELSRLQPLPGV